MDEESQRPVAVKVLNTGTMDSVQVRRFEREALALRRLAHPGIAALLDLVDHGTERLMVMELLTGETLDHLVHRQGPLPPARAGALVVQVLSALADAHGEGIVHRDLKPSNLMLTDDGPLKILDFGVALIAGADPLTDAGLLVGTPSYMAPEQVTGAPVDARTDLYSAGLVLYFLVTGKLPFTGRTPALLAQARLDATPAPARSHIHGLPGWVDAVLARALARHPGERYQSADEFREALEAGIRSQPPTGGGVVLPPEAETVAMPIPDFARQALPSAPPAVAPVAAAGASRAGAGPAKRQPVSSGVMLAAAIVIAAVMALLLLIR
jgi:serine/threonine-protein kinase